MGIIQLYVLAICETVYEYELSQRLVEREVEDLQIGHSNGCSGINGQSSEF